MVYSTKFRSRRNFRIFFVGEIFLTTIKALSANLSCVKRDMFEAAIKLVLPVLKQDFATYYETKAYPHDLPDEEALPNIRRIRSQTMMYYEYIRKIERSKKTAKQDPGIRVVLFANVNG